MMFWKEFRKPDAELMFQSWQIRSIIDVKCPKESLDLRKDLLELFENMRDSIAQDSPRGKEYSVDLFFGLEFYVLMKEKYKLTQIDASNDLFWISLSIYVIPDIVGWRWDINSKDRFYSNPRRIWLKVIWWYIHLSWQGSKEKTLDILIKNTTDEIVQLVERSGAHGYRLKMCREIMRKYGSFDNSLRSRNNSLFRRVMKLNTARVVVLEPALYEGEEEGYVNELFSVVVSTSK